MGMLARWRGRGRACTAMVGAVAVWAVAVTALAQPAPSVSGGTRPALEGIWEVAWHDHPEVGAVTRVRVAIAHYDPASCDAGTDCRWGSVAMGTGDPGWVLATGFGVVRPEVREAATRTDLAVAWPYGALGTWDGRSQLELGADGVVHGRWSYAERGGTETWTRIPATVERVAVRAAWAEGGESKVGGAPPTLTATYRSELLGRDDDAPGNRARLYLTLYGRGLWGPAVVDLEGAPGLQPARLSYVGADGGTAWEIHPRSSAIDPDRVVGVELEVLLWPQARSGVHAVRLNGTPYPFEVAFLADPRPAVERTLALPIVDDADVTDRRADAATLLGDLANVEAALAQVVAARRDEAALLRTHAERLEALRRDLTARTETARAALADAAKALDDLALDTDAMPEHLALLVAERAAQRAALAAAEAEIVAARGRLEASRRDRLLGVIDAAHAALARLEPAVARAMAPLDAAPRGPAGPVTDRQLDADRRRAAADVAARGLAIAALDAQGFDVARALAHVASEATRTRAVLEPFEADLARVRAERVVAEATWRGLATSGSIERVVAYADGVRVLDARALASGAVGVALYDRWRAAAAQARAAEAARRTALRGYLDVADRVVGAEQDLIAEQWRAFAAVAYQEVHASAGNLVVAGLTGGPVGVLVEAVTQVALNVATWHQDGGFGGYDPAALRDGVQQALDGELVDEAGTCRSETWSGRDPPRPVGWGAPMGPPLGGLDAAARAALELLLKPGATAAVSVLDALLDRELAGAVADLRAAALAGTLADASALAPLVEVEARIAAVAAASARREAVIARALDPRAAAAGAGLGLLAGLAFDLVRTQQEQAIRDDERDAWVAFLALEAHARLAWHDWAEAACLHDLAVAHEQQTEGLYRAFMEGFDPERGFLRTVDRPFASDAGLVVEVAASAATGTDAWLEVAGVRGVAIGGGVFRFAPGALAAWPHDAPLPMVWHLAARDADERSGR